MSVLRPKYQLNRAQVEGARTTIPARSFSKLTTRRFPYPRVGTRAPDGMFPYKTGNPGNPGMARVGGFSGRPSGRLGLYRAVAPPTRPGLGATIGARGKVTVGPYAGGVTSPKFTPGVLKPKYLHGDGNPLVRLPYGYARDAQILKRIGGMPPHYILNKAEIQGVMPATTYTRLTAKYTTAPELPPAGRAPVLRAPTLQWDWGTFFWGCVAGGVVALGMAYGVIPALAEWGKAEIRRRY